MKKMCSISLMMIALALLTPGAPVHAAQMDSRIELSFTTFPTGDDIKIESVNGVVSLTGIVSEESYKSLFQETVAGLSGVKSVDNRLEVKGERLSKNSDAWLTMKVKTTLLFHRSVSAGTTEIDVKDGIVTLRGVAASQPQKDLTTEYAKDVDGVKHIKNEMVVTSPSKNTLTVGDQINDAFITAQVKITRLYHHWTSALNTSVTTKEGVFALGGKTGNAAELNLPTKFADDVNGVKGVNNRMIIE